MQKNNGFTLIEMVIVIVVLGILAVTAAPKFINIQDDAMAATMQSLKGSIITGAKTIHSKAIIEGLETQPDSKLDFIDDKGNKSSLTLKYGYPSNQSIQFVVEYSGFAMDREIGDKDKVVVFYPERYENIAKEQGYKKIPNDCYITYEAPSKLGQLPSVRMPRDACKG